MSVQAGIWNFDGEPVNRGILEVFSHMLAEHGPDGETMYIDGNIGMLYRPFHSTRESRLERQPHTSLCGNLITWDGRLDNRDELISQLLNDLPVVQTDVAIVSAAFDRWHTQCFGKLVGDWALTIWNPQERELILARDYIGIRPLYYYPQLAKAIWCSHLAPLALCGDKFTISDEYIAGYLAFYPETDVTPYNEIRTVPPGNFVMIRERKTSIHCYWAFNGRRKTRYKTDAEYEEQYRNLLRQAVQRRLRTDSPVLADLSGGLDSSSVVCVADKLLAEHAAEAPKVDTFSFYDSNEVEDDDFPHFLEVEKARGRKGFHTDLRGSGDSLSFQHHEFVARPGANLRTEIKSALSDVCQHHGYRVLLSGDGGDDLNGQALDPRIHLAELFLQLRFGQMSKDLTAWSLVIRKRPWIQLFFQALLQLMPLFIRAQLTEQARVESWVSPTFAAKHGISSRQLSSIRQRRHFFPGVRDAAETISTLSRRVSCVEPTVIDKRRPYFDQNLVEFLTSIPLDQLLRPGQRRFLMRRSLVGVLPSKVLVRKTKASMGRWFCIALEKHWHTVEHLFASPITSRLGYIEKDCILDALLALRNGQTPTHTLRLLRALSLEVWLRDLEARGVISA